MRDFLKSLFEPIPDCPPDLPIELHSQRFQCQKWYVRLWRYRYYLTVPVRSIHWWIADRLNKDSRKESFRNYWHLAIGIVQGPMKWYYTMFETFGRIQERFGSDLANEFEEIFIEDND